MFDFAECSLRAAAAELGNVLLCRVYVERSDMLSLRLYITRIDESDAGLYTCTAAVAPAVSRDSQTSPNHTQQPSSRQRRMLTLSQQTKLFLYGQFLANRTACSMIGYWYDNVVCLSVRLSVTLCTVAKVTFLPLIVWVYRH